MKINSIFFKLEVLIFALYPIINSYAIFEGVGFGDFLLLIIMVVNLFKCKKIMLPNMYICIFVSYLIINNLINIMVGYTQITSFIRQIFYFICIFVCPIDEKKKSLLKIYIKNICLIACLFALLNTLLFYSIGFYIPWLLPLKLNYGTGNVSEYFKMYDELYSYNYRATSFFLEPSYFAQYIILTVIFSYKNFKFTTHRQKGEFVILLVSLLLTKSFFGLAMILILFMLLNSKKILRLDLKIFIIGLIIGLVLFIVMYSRILNIFQKGTSSYERLFSYFEILKRMNFFNIIFGLGASGHELFAPMIYETNKFYNSFGYLLMCYGIIGLVLFLLSIIRGVKGNTNIKILVILLLFFESVYINAYFVVLLIILFEKKENRGIEYE